MLETEFLSAVDGCWKNIKRLRDYGRVARVEATLGGSNRRYMNRPFAHSADRIGGGGGALFKSESTAAAAAAAAAAGVGGGGHRRAAAPPHHRRLPPRRPVPPGTSPLHPLAQTYAHAPPGRRRHAHTPDTGLRRRKIFGRR